ncbi:hypothetical protein BH09ACT6_BH09ACT6_17910 [soil metagenome]
MIPGERPEPPHSGDEGAMLLGFLDLQRATIAHKARELSDTDMIEEMARHAGHLDILREQLDGVTGE